MHLQHIKSTASLLQTSGFLGFCTAEKISLKKNPPNPFRIFSKGIKGGFPFREGLFKTNKKELKIMYEYSKEEKFLYKMRLRNEEKLWAKLAGPVLVTYKKVNDLNAPPEHRRSFGTNPRAKGTNPRAKGTNPRRSINHHPHL